MRFTDRSRLEADWACRRRRYWLTEHGGRGIVPVEAPPRLALGLGLHTALEGLGRGDRPEEAARTLEAATVNLGHHQRLALGLFWGFHRQAWPALCEEFDVSRALVEPEVTCLLTPSLTFMARPDILLPSRQGWWRYVEYKSTSTKKTQWLSSWDSAVQLHAGMVAAERALGIEVREAMVQGLYKGYEENGQLYSPFVWGYRKEGRPGVIPDQYSVTYMRGWERIPTTAYPTGIRGWVECEMTEGQLQEQLPRTPPIFPKREMVEEFFKQAIIREGEIADAAPLDESHLHLPMLRQVFPQTFSACDPGWGDPCPYKACCWNPVVSANPVGSGLYQVRVPHHAAEKGMR